VTQASSQFSTPRPRPWFAAAVLLIAFASLYAFDVYLASVERGELAAEAMSYFDQGQRLASERRYEEAIPIYRRAAALQRNNRSYRLALARALVASGRYEESAPILAEALRDDPNDGPTNLEMARALRAQHDTDAAAAYFHGAIYGSWATSGDRNSLTARLELVEMLAGEHRERELLSELLPLEDLATGNVALQARVAELLLIAGSPARAAAVYRTLVQETPEDARAYSGLGNAELALGNYRAARSAYSAALRHGGDAGVREALERAAELDQLDPTQRRLSLHDKFERSRQILARSMAVLEQCSASAGAASLALQKRAVALSEKRHAPDDPEEVLATAEDIWQFMQRKCPETAQRDRTLASLMERLQQRP
jgi:tetratricopeptide (TPR) repeat protein